MSDNRSFHSEVIRERDSLIERLKARDNQINELLKQTAANRVLLERINELEHELKEAQAECSDLGEQRDAAITETSTVRMERNEAQAAAAVMRGCLEQALSKLEEGASNKEYDPSWIRPKGLNREQVNDRCIQAYHQIHQALSTTAGTAFLERMAEAEWLVKNAIANDSVNAKRRDAFLKGEGVKA